MKRTCAICGWRDASHVTEWDGRTIAACAACDEPKIRLRDPFRVGRSRKLDIASPFAQAGDRMAAIVDLVERNPGSTWAQLGAAAGVPPRSVPGATIVMDRFKQSLMRAARRGLVRVEGGGSGVRGRRYYPREAA